MLIARLHVIATMLLCYQHSFSQVPIPTFKTFQPISIDRSAPPPSPTPIQRPCGYNPLLPNDPYREQNLKTMKQGGMDILEPPVPAQHKQVNEILITDQQAAEIAYRQFKSQAYQYNFWEYLRLNPDSFSFSRAVYLSESAWYDDPPDWREFEDSVKKYAAVVKQLLRREGLNVKNNTAINYGVQKLYRQNNTFYNAADKQFHKIPKLAYDFNDPMGHHNWSNMFVYKLMKTGVGQCHNLPVNYLCVVQQLGGKAYLALAPGHSYVQYFDEEGARYSFETTNGHFIPENWMMQSTGVSAAALKKGTYLDTLSSRKLYAHCLADMLLGYVQKITYDGVAEQMIQKILDLDSTNITALSVQADYLTKLMMNEIRNVGFPPPDQLPRYPAAYAIYEQRMAVYTKLENIGAQSLPPDAYRQWLQSMNDNSQKEQEKQIYEKLLRALQKQKKIKTTFENNTKKQ
ncbi:MAG: hypothetical protein ACTHLE_12285 [Agriterribacter sp.]